MTNYQAIFVRRSVRHYNPDSLSQRQLALIGSVISSLKPLQPSLRVSFEILTRDQLASRYRTAINAPYYIVLSAERTQAGSLCAGYMAEQLVLSLTAMGLGTCWIGSARSLARDPEGLPFLALISFGKPRDESLFDRPYPHKRKPLDRLILDSDKPSKAALNLLSAARLAPSGVNHQPCRYLVRADAIALVCTRPWLPMLKFSVWMEGGIALAHLDAAAQEKGFSIRETDLSAYARGKTKLTYLYGLILA